MSDLVFLDDLNKRPLVVLKADRLFIADVYKRQAPDVVWGQQDEN